VGVLFFYIHKYQSRDYIFTHHKERRGKNIKATLNNKGVMFLARRRPVMSESLKYEIAKELGVDDIVKREGWGSVSSRDCGNMVRVAVEKAEEIFSQRKQQ